jgi:hypothetical protein
MPTFPLRIRFTSAALCYERFHHFPPDTADFIESMTRKRDGDCQVMLLGVATEAHLQDFLALCRAERGIVEVLPITESEFVRAPSNSI